MDFYRKVAAIFILILMIVPFVTLSAPGEERKPGEYEVKAVFIYNLAKFIEWPDKSLGSSSTLTVYILGDDPFGSDWDAITGKLIKGKRIVVQPIDSPDDLGKAGILFISSSEKENLRDILKRTSGLPILTVGDTKSFAQRGVMINFYIENNKIRFEINLEAANLAGLKISSNVLRMGTIVSPAKGRGN
jgi:YfiR/HmsC-like